MTARKTSRISVRSTRLWRSLLLVFMAGFLGVVQGTSNNDHNSYNYNMMMEGSPEQMLEEQQQRFLQASSTVTMPNGTVINVDTSNFVERKFYFLYRAFSTNSDSATVVQNIGQAVQGELQAFLAKFPLMMQLEDVVSDVEDGTCDPKAYTAVSYSNCAYAKSTVRVYASPKVDEVILQRACLYKVRTFLDTNYNVANVNSVYVMYDYPKPVSTSLVMVLVGQDTTMDQEDQDLFIKTFRTGFEPIITNASYVWVEGKVMVQMIGYKNVNRNIAVNETADTSDKFNTVQTLLRAQCSGDACTDDNYRNFVLQEAGKWVPAEFLGRLSNVGPSNYQSYFDYLQKIYISTQEQIVQTLAPSTDINTADTNVQDNTTPGWVWPIIIACLCIIGCACVYTCFRAPLKQYARHKQIKKEESAEEEDDPRI